MAILSSILLVVQILSAIGVIVLVLLQHGKGADMGAAFGSGASGSLFGASGSANFLSRLTAASAAVFFVTTLGLAYLANAGMVSRSSGSELEKRLGSTPAKTEAPKVDATKADVPKVDAPKTDASVPAAPANNAAPAKSGEIPK